MYVKKVLNLQLFILIVNCWKETIQPRVKETKFLYFTLKKKTQSSPVGVNLALLFDKVEIKAFIVLRRTQSRPRLDSFSFRFESFWHFRNDSEQRRVLVPQSGVIWFQLVHRLNVQRNRNQVIYIKRRKFENFLHKKSTWSVKFSERARSFSSSSISANFFTTIFFSLFSWSVTALFFIT